MSSRFSDLRSSGRPSDYGGGSPSSYHDPSNIPSRMRAGPRGKQTEFSNSSLDYTDDRSQDSGDLPRPNGPEHRSRTPGPDFMRGWDREDDAYLKRSQEMRSKTPTPQQDAPRTNSHLNMSGTPDFIPASLYQSPHRNSDRGRRDFKSPTRGNIPLSASYPSPTTARNALNSSPCAQSPLHRKHTTSFEHEEPSSHSSRYLPPWDDSPSGSLDRSRSPASLEEPGARYSEMTVTLRRQETGFGFRIIGGTEEGSQVSVLSMHNLLISRACADHIMMIIMMQGSAAGEPFQVNFDAGTED